MGNHHGPPRVTFGLCLGGVIFTIGLFMLGGISITDVWALRPDQIPALKPATTAKAPVPEWTVERIALLVAETNRKIGALADVSQGVPQDLQDGTGEQRQQRLQLYDRLRTTYERLVETLGRKPMEEPDRDPLLADLRQTLSIMVSTQETVSFMRYDKMLDDTAELARQREAAVLKVERAKARLERLQTELEAVSKQWRSANERLEQRTADSGSPVLAWQLEGFTTESDILKAQTAVEQLHFICLLKFADLLGQCRLRDVERIGGSGETSSLRDIME